VEPPDDQGHHELSGISQHDRLRVAADRQGRDDAAVSIDPFEGWLWADAVPGFLHRYGQDTGAVLDVGALLDRLLDTHVGRDRWLTLPGSGPVTVELAGEPGTGAVELRARPTGPGADEALARLRALGVVYGR
jgi:hypothetical protein